MRPSLLSILSLTVCLVALPGCNRGGSQEGGGGLTEVRFGVSPFQDTLVPILGKEKGWYEEEGLDVDFRILGWTEVQEALTTTANNRIDVGINNISSVVSTHHRNPELVYYYGFNTFDDGFALMVRPDGPLRTVNSFLEEGISRDEAIRQTAAQLEGRRVVTTANTDMEQGVAAARSRGGLGFSREDDIIDLPPDEGLAAFLTGEGDAYIGGVPQRTRAAQEGMAEMLTGLDLGPAPINGIVTTRTYAESNPDVMRKLLRVWFRIVEYVDANTEEAGGIIVGILNDNSGANFTVADFVRFWNNIEHYPPTPSAIEAEILSPTGRNYWGARWDDSNNYFMNVAGVIPRPVDPDSAFYMLRAQEEYIAEYGDGPYTPTP